MALRPIAKPFLQANKCCVDDYFSLKARDLFGSAEAMCSSGCFRACIRSWRRSPLSNMHLERLLALIKRSAPGRSPNVERMLSSGYLTQVLTDHVTHGQRDPRVFDVERLLADGVPLEQGTSSVCTPVKRKGPSEGMIWSNEKVSKECQRRLNLDIELMSHTERNDLLRKGHDEWR